jgi:predicted unusual protein kinase regulating ubiquinone biosynthesis (AarF/ABC1/UbiB family)
MAERERVFRAFFDLTLAELFHLGLMQTDPNFANFLYAGPGQPLGLIDFGAVRDIPIEVSKGYRTVLGAALDGTRADLDAALEGLGVLADSMDAQLRASILDLTEQSFAPLREGGLIDFTDRSMAAGIRDDALQMRSRDLSHTPPPALIFIQRKLAGVYLLGARLGLKVDLTNPLRAVL